VAVADDVGLITFHRDVELGLHLNVAECELISDGDSAVSEAVLQAFTPDIVDTTPLCLALLF
jgi:hypothetical protein